MSWYANAETLTNLWRHLCSLENGEECASHGSGRHSQRSSGGRSQGDQSGRLFGSSLHNPWYPGLLRYAIGPRTLDAISELQPWLGAANAPRTITCGSRGTSITDIPRSRDSRGDAYPVIWVLFSADRPCPHSRSGSHRPPPCSITTRTEEDGWSSEDDSGYSEDERTGGIIQRREVLELKPEYSCERCPRC